MRPIPSSAIAGGDRFDLAKIAVRHCLLPNPDVVAAFSGALLPVIRASTKRGQRGEVKDFDGRELLCDDNTSPKWALLWSHGLRNNPRKGWTFAHVWDESGDPAAYTRLANLCMIPESLSGLSDKDGPLVEYLRFHAFDRYGWAPRGQMPKRPEQYDMLEWRYLEPIDDPQAAFLERLLVSSDKRAILLRQLMKRDGIPHPAGEGQG